MMKLLTSFSIIIFFGFILLPSFEIMANTIEPFDSLQEISNGFPDSIQIKKGKEISIEFCPDNTCDLVVADNKVPLNNLKDFACLYIYYFSDYSVLNEWRNREASITAAKQILSKTQYLSYRRTNDEETARCILRHLSKNGQIKLYMVRYDEKARILVRKNINKAIAIEHDR